ncbi:MAG: flagellar export protein FliJ [Sulfurimonas sp.]|jgi:flagellar biosynthesis chaperone FliJ
MKTRFSSLVTLKKSTMDKSERVVQKANAGLNSASTALELSYKSLENIDAPKSGSMSQMIANRTLLHSQRDIIKQNQEWVEFSKNQVQQAKEQLKSDMIEHEKFKYLELEEIKIILKKRKIEEAKILDEVALMTHARKSNI